MNKNVLFTRDIEFIYNDEFHVVLKFAIEFAHQIFGHRGQVVCSQTDNFNKRIEQFGDRCSTVYIFEISGSPNALLTPKAISTPTLFYCNTRTDQTRMKVDESGRS